jgi:hypothetical protein
MHAQNNETVALSWRRCACRGHGSYLISLCFSVRLETSAAQAVDVAHGFMDEMLVGDILLFPEGVVFFLEKTCNFFGNHLPRGVVQMFDLFHERIHDRS